MASIQIENISVWTNKFQGSSRLHMKEKSEPSEKGKYLFLTQKEAASLEGKLIVALSGGFSEIEVRGGAVPVTLYTDGDAFSFIHGGEKAGYKSPKGKVTFSRNGLTNLRENIRMLKKSPKVLEKMDEQNVKKLDKFKNKAKIVKKQEDKPEMERQDELSLYHPLILNDDCTIEESQQGFLF